MSTQDPWTPERIKALRTERGQSQTAFGLELFDTTPESAQNAVAKMEAAEGKVHHRAPGTAVRRTLQRMEDGEI